MMIAATAASRVAGHHGRQRRFSTSSHASAARSSSLHRVDARGSTAGRHRGTLTSRGAEPDVTRCDRATHATLYKFWDQAYYPCLEATIGRPYALYVHGGSDTTGAVRSVETIATGLKWKRLREPLSIVGEVDATGHEACWELGATVAASLMSA